MVPGIARADITSDGGFAVVPPRAAGSAGVVALRRGIGIVPVLGALAVGAGVVLRGGCLFPPGLLGLRLRSLSIQLAFHLFLSNA
jgi:hypothetical protein